MHMHKNDGQYEFAHLDRIYTARPLANALFKWKSRPVLVPSDHWPVSVKYAPKDAPLIGNSRWTLPLKAIQDKDLMNEITKKGINAQMQIKAMCNIPPETCQECPQTIWQELKSNIACLAKKLYKNETFKMMSNVTAQLAHMPENHEGMHGNPMMGSGRLPEGRLEGVGRGW